MIPILREALTLLSPKERRSLFWLAILACVAAIVQTVSILAVMPFIVLLANPGLLQTNAIFIAAYDLVGAESYLGFLATFGLVGILTLTLGNVFLAFEQYFAHRYLCFLSHRIENKVLRKILDQNYEQHMRQHSARQSDVVLSHVDRVVDDVIGTSLSVISSIAMTSFIVIMLLVVSFKATLITLVGLIVVYLLVFVALRKKLAEHGEDFTELSGNLFTHVKEVFDGIQEIKSRKAEDYFARRFEASRLSMFKLAVKSGLLGFLPHFILETLIFSGLVGISLYFILTTQSSGVSISFIALYGIAIYRLVPALKSIFEGLANIHHEADAVRIVLEQCRLAESDVAQQRIAEPKTEIGLKAVSYAYSGRDAQVRDISFNVPVSSSICLFGASGSGKSTILNLLAGLLYPQSGVVYNDDQAVTATTRDSWRGMVGYCPQSVFLFDDTVASNIAFGQEAGDIDYHRVAAVAKVAQIDKFIQQQLTDRYETVIGEGGKTLSGGQKQRLGMARALYLEPRLLLLDESFNGLDAPVRDAILDALFSLADTTLIFSSHDTDIAARCDKVALVEQGRVLAFDNYAAIASQLRIGGE